MATLRIYNSIEDDKPSKEFVCLRTNMAINNKLEDLGEEADLLNKEANAKLASITDKTSDKELAQIKADIKEIKVKMNENTLECIRLFFPNFTDEDYLKLDPADYQEFIFEINKMRNDIYNRASKN